jgi:ribonuclease P protein component
VPAPTVGRITTRAAFAELQRSRARGSSGPVRAVFVPAESSAPGVFPQVGYAVGKQCGSAVVRNSLRRRAREVIRGEAHRLPRGTYLLRFSPDSAAAKPEAFRADVAKALQRASRDQAADAR